MNRKYKRYINVFMFIAVAIFMLIGWMIGEASEYNLYKQDAVLITPDEQIDYEDGSRLYLISLKDSDNISDSIYFYTNHQQAYVYCDDVLVYSIEKANTIYSHSTGSVINIVRIPENAENVKIIIEPVYNNVPAGDIEIFLGDGVTMYENEIVDSMSAMLICLFIITIGICLIIYFYLIQHKRNSFREILCLGLFAFLLGTWALLETLGAVILVKNRPLASYNGFFMLVVMNIPFVAFVYYFLEVKKSIYHRICIVIDLLDIFILTLLQILGIRDIKQNAIFAQLALAVSAVYFCYAISVALKKRETIRKAYINLFGAVIIIGTVILDLTAYYKDIIHSNQISKFGFLLYIIILAVYTAKESRKALEAARKAHFYREMAITDSLADCYNRNAFNIDIETIDVKKESIDIVQFDLNNLKQCNDTRGHAAGDEYIKGASNLIKNIFGKTGKLYRMGGDEFCIIAKNTSEEQIDQLISELKSEEAKYYQTEDGLKLAIACGHAHYDEIIDENLDDTLKRADENMYKDKKEIKGISD